jgi:hypothetical protein
MIIEFLRNKLHLLINKLTGESFVKGYSYTRGGKKIFVKPYHRSKRK